MKLIMKKINRLFIIILTLAILIILIPNLNITGFAIDETNSISITIFFIGIVFLFFLFFTLSSNLEKRLEDQKKADESSTTENQAEYISRYTPEYLKRDKAGFIYNATRLFGKLKTKDIHGRENLPKGPKLFIMSHRKRMGEIENIYGSLGEQVHIAAGENLNWRNPVLAYFLRRLGMVPIKESLSKLTEEQKKELLSKLKSTERENYRDVMENENRFNSRNKDYIRMMTALLMRGKNIGIFVEGPYTHIKDYERSAYAGYSLVAREYKRRTGKDIPIVPVSFRNGKVGFGESFYVDEDKKMTHKELEKIATERIHSIYDSL